MIYIYMNNTIYGYNINNIISLKGLFYLEYYKCKFFMSLLVSTTVTSYN